MIESDDQLPTASRVERKDDRAPCQEVHLYELFEQAPDAGILTSLEDARILRVNREFTRLFGYTAEEAIGKSLRQVVMPDGVEPILQEDPDFLAGRKVEWDVVRRRNDGTRFHAEVTGKRIQLGDGEHVAYLVFRDISARKRADALFAGEKRLLELMAAGASLPVTLHAVCRLAEAADDGLSTSILLLDHTGSRILRGFGPSLPPSYVSAFDGWPIGLGIGPCAEAAHLGEQIVSLNLAADERWTPEFRRLASAHELRACWSTPIQSSEGRMLGTFAVYPDKCAGPTLEQKSRIERLTHLASLAIEHAQSLDALRRSEERYALAMEAASDGHMDWNLMTGEFYISHRMLKMIGHRPDATFADRADWVRRFPFHPEDRARWETAIAAHFAGREAKFSGDFRVVVGDEVRWLAFNFVAKRDADGKVVRWTGSIADVNDAKRDIATVLNHIPGLVAILTPSGEVDAVNSELVAYCGQPLEAMRQWGTNGIVHAEDLPRVSAIFMNAMSTGEPYDFEARVRRFDGVYRWNQVRGLPYRDASDRIVRWYVLLSDIDATKRAEESLRLSDERYALAMRASGEGHWDWKIATDEFYASPRYLELAGFPPDMKYSRRSDIVPTLPFHQDDRAPYEAAVAAHFAGETPRLDMVVRLVPGGEIRWLHVIGMCSRDADGKPVRWAGSVNDITARKAAEDALRVSDERYALAMEAALEGHFDADLDTGQMFVSARVNEIYNFPRRAEIVNRAEFLKRLPIHPDDRRVIDDISKPEFVRSEWRQPTQDFFEYDCRIIPRPGDVRWIHVRGKVLRDAGGRVRRRLGVVADITARKAAEDALRESEKRYERAMLAAEAGFWDWDVPADEFYASPKLLEMADLPPGTRFSTRTDFLSHLPFHSDDRSKWTRAVEERFASGGTRVAMEIRFIHGEGTRWVLLSGMCVRDSTGNLLRWTGSATDITDRKTAEDELRESEARFRGLTALWSDWYWRQDEHLRFTYSTAAIDPPDGYPGGSAIGKTRWELPGIVPLSSSWSDHRKLLAAHRPFRDFEYSRPGTDGTLRYISTSGTPVFDESGKFSGYHGVGRDITDRKRVEEELRSRQQMLEVAQKAARAAAFEWQVGAGLGANRWSPDLEAMHGIPVGSYDGTYESWKHLVHPADWPNIQVTIKAAEQTGDVDAEYRVLHAGGVVRWLHAIGRLLFDSEGKATRIVGFVLDVTDRHLAEEELQRIERQLRQAQRLEALGTLAGGIAHDFNNLLGAILGYGEMAFGNSRAGSRLRRDIENIMIAGERGRALVERILAFSRSGLGERVAVNVQRIVRETLALFAAKLPRHIEIEPRLHAGDAAVMGDATQIHQVLMNLLTNAAQAMPSGGTLRVSLDRYALQAARVVTTGSLGPQNYVVMDVSDSGSGISPEVFEKMFDPFFTTKEVGVGTGLGLSLVHGITTGLGGAIDVSTTIGGGSAFKVYLPMVSEVAIPTKLPEQVERKRRRMGRTLVMVVDDEKPLVNLATATLAEFGYSAVGFTSSAKAIQAFMASPERFDAVITDESMPGISGSKLIGKMRSLRPTIPFLLVSGFVSPALLERAREAGATEVLKKPLPARQLQMALDRVLQPPRHSDAKERRPSKLSTAPAVRSNRR